MFAFVTAALLQVASFTCAPATASHDEEVKAIMEVLTSGDGGYKYDEAQTIAGHIVDDTTDKDGGIGGWGHDVMKYLTSDGGIGGWGHDYAIYFQKHTDKAQQVVDIVSDGGIGGWGHD